MTEYDKLKDFIYDNEKVINWQSVIVKDEPVKIFYRLNEINNKKGMYGFLLIALITGDLTQDPQGNYSFDEDQEVDQILTARACYDCVDKIWFEYELDYPDIDQLIKILQTIDNLAKKYCGGYGLP